MSTLLDLHVEAMHLADEAEAAREAGDREACRQFALRALAIEVSAAEQVEKSEQNEPTRSMLYQNASALALLAERFEDALQLAAEGLAGSPPPRVQNELVSLIERSTHERHLMLRGVEILDTEIQVALTGNEVSDGRMFLREFIRRIEATTRMLARSLQREAGLSFDGKAIDGLLGHETLISQPRAGSFAVTIGLTNSLTASAKSHSQLPLTYDVSNAVTSLVTEITLLQEHRMSDLQNSIGDPSYFESFIANARELAPDGRRITLIGLTAPNVAVTLTRSQDDLQEIHSRMFARPEVPISAGQIERFQLVGVLNFARSKQKSNSFGIKPDKGKELIVSASDSIVEVVRTYFGERVSVEVESSDGKLRMVGLPVSAPSEAE